MKLYKCNDCGHIGEMPDDTRLIIHKCGSGNVVHLCPVCNKEFDFDFQTECKNCKAELLAKLIISGQIGLCDAIRSL